MIVIASLSPIVYKPRHFGNCGGLLFFFFIMLETVICTLINEAVTKMGNVTKVNKALFVLMRYILNNKIPNLLLVITKLVYIIKYIITDIIANAMTIENRSIHLICVFYQLFWSMIRSVPECAVHFQNEFDPSLL